MRISDCSSDVRSSDLPSAVETGHGDLEAVAFLAQPVFDRHPHSVQIDLRGRLRMPAELLLLRAEGDARHVFLNDQAGNALCALAPGADHGDIKFILDRKSTRLNSRH